MDDGWSELDDNDYNELCRGLATGTWFHKSNKKKIED